MKNNYQFDQNLSVKCKDIKDIILHGYGLLNLHELKTSTVSQRQPLFLSFFSFSLGQMSLNQC